MFENINCKGGGAFCYPINSTEFSSDIPRLDLNSSILINLKFFSHVRRSSPILTISRIPLEVFAARAPE